MRTVSQGVEGVVVDDVQHHAQAQPVQPLHHLPAAAAHQAARQQGLRSVMELDINSPSAAQPGGGEPPLSVAQSPSACNTGGTLHAVQ